MVSSSIKPQSNDRMMGFEDTLDNRTPTSFSFDASWASLRDRLRDRLGETAYRRWIEPVTARGEGAGDACQLVMSIPTRFMRDWIEAHYGDTVRVLWRQIAKNGDVDFTVAPPIAKTTNTIQDAKVNAFGNALSGLSRSEHQPIMASTADESPLDPRFTFDNFVVGKPNELAYAAARRVAETETPTFNPLFL